MLARFAVSVCFRLTKLPDMPPICAIRAVLGMELHRSVTVGDARRHAAGLALGVNAFICGLPLIAGAVAGVAWGARVASGLVGMEATGTPSAE